MGTNPSGAGIENGTSSSNDLLADVSGILLLLSSAKRALQTHAAEPACIDRLTTCICRIGTQYNLTDRDFNEGPTSKETSMDGILRLLEYVEGEVREDLHDCATADELRHCIQLLANSRRRCRKPGDTLRSLVFSEISLSVPKTALS